MSKELLVSVLGLDVEENNGNGTRDGCGRGVDSVCENHVQDVSPASSGDIAAKPGVFAVTALKAGLALTLCAPHMHASTRWRFDGVAQDSKGNRVVVPHGVVAVEARSAKGVFHYVVGAAQ